MQSFRFQLRCRGELRHSMTCDCSDHHEAWKHALAACSDMLRDSGAHFKPGDGWMLEVKTSAGEHCWRLAFSTSGVELN
ncbi:DUF6894 family protein [Mesorhizobium liriopis]|uniref:DUF6894 family protein n=1 Tax=Mesorhizobium liriopis TaxID=2953882 RepID=UPI003EBE6700